MVPITDKITGNIVEEFKDQYVKETGLGVESDDTFKKMLKTAYAYIIEHTDEFDINEEPTGKQLVFDRVRYVRANASELFYENYLADMNGFGLKLAMERDTNDSQEDS